MAQRPITYKEKINQMINRSKEIAEDLEELLEESSQAEKPYLKDAIRNYQTCYIPLISLKNMMSETRAEKIINQ